jgi:hypothetical protein
MQLYKAIFRYYPIASTYHALAFMKSVVLRRFRKLYRDSPHRVLAPEEIYAPHGSFIALNRKYFESGGDLNYGAFLTGEEIFIAETARRLGLVIVYDSRLRVIHHEHATFARYTSRQLLAFLREATDYITDTFFRGKATSP